MADTLFSVALTVSLAFASVALGQADGSEASPTEPPDARIEAEGVPDREEGEEPAAREFFLALDGKKNLLSRSSLAVTVLTRDDLRALGVHTLPEALRYVPGVDVFQLNGFTYAAGVRGVDDEFNPRFQVYLDGRLVNVAEFGGVDWESLPVSIEDIDRIEIIRGAGISGESGHALNGAIRIYTRKPDEVSLFTYSGYYGSHDTHLHFGRVGGSVGPLSGKAAVEYREDNGLAGGNSIGLGDASRLLKFNLQGVWNIEDATDFTVGFAGVHGRVNETNGPPISSGPTNTDNYAVTARLRRIFANGIRASLQYSFEDFTLKVLNHPNAALKGRGNNIDLGRTTNTFFATTRVPVNSYWDVTASGGWKGDRLSFDMNEPRKDNQELLHFHLGTEARLWEQLVLSAGGRFEKDLFAGDDLSPHAGLVYEFLPDNSLRASYRVGRRQPNFAETSSGFVVPNPVPPPGTLPLLTGNPALDRETVEAYEAGYRGHFRDLGLLVDTQLFLHNLRDKVEFVPDLTSPVPGALTFANQGRERGLGAELYAEWQVYGPVSVYGTYTYQRYRDRRNSTTLRNRPEHKFNLGSRLHIKEGFLQGLSASINLNWVSEVKQTDLLGVEHTIDDRFRLDFRIAKKFFKDRVELAFIGRNLTDNETLEFRPPFGSNFDGAFGAGRMFLVNLVVDL